VALPAEKLIVCPVLVGRERYLAALAPVYGGVVSGVGRIIAISGEAGLGKSRLVGETKQRILGLAGEAGVRVMQGHCFEPDSSMPYAPFIDLLRTCLTTHDAAEVRECLGPDGPELCKLVPELLALMPELTAPPPGEPEQEKRRIFHAFCQFVSRLAEREPLIIVIEDMHWSDDVSLELLAQLARRVKTQAIAVVITFRSDEVQPPLRQLLAGLDREHVLLEWPLERLGTHEVERMIQEIFELDTPVRAEFLDAIYSLTEGNPFFIEEVLKSMVAAGDIFYADGGWDRKPIEQLQIPRSIQAAVNARTAHLSGEAARTLRIAAVAGRRFDFDLLQLMLSSDEHTLLSVMKELVAAQLVTEESADHFAFRHALTQQTIYTEMLARERRALHRDLAAALRQLSKPSVDARLPELAHHFYAAESWDEAYYYCLRQAEAAQNVNAPAAAALQFSRAIEAAHHLGISVPLATYRARGKAYEATGRFDDALADYQRTLDMASAAGDRPAECRALLDVGFLWLGRDYERAGAFFRRASDMAARLGDPVLEAHALNRLGNWLVNTGEAGDGVALHERALAAFRAAGDDTGIIETLDLLGMAYGLNGDPRAGVAALSDAITMLRPQGPSLLLCSSLTTRATWSGPNQCEVAYSALRGFEATDHDAREAITMAQQLDSPAALSYAMWVSGGVQESFGHISASEHEAAEGLRIAIEIGHEQWMAGAEYTRGRTALAMLAMERAIKHLTEAGRLARAVGSAFWLDNCASYLALTHLSMRDRSAAESVLASVRPESHEPRGLSERRVLWAWGRLALESGDPERALAISGRLRAAAHRGAGDEQPIPALLSLEGEALLAMKRTEEASEALTAARSAAVARGALTILWPIEGLVARAHQGLRHTEEAERACADARRTIELLASTIEDANDRERFEREALESLPKLRPPSENRAAKQAFGGLTAREREVAGLVAQGRSNRDIADELVLGERTIETHVGNILSKLGFTSRAQIAAWAVESGLTKAL
jgi:DNA-binding CsgD family transcriptional regulator